jgi:hypothetical protein
MPSMVSTQHQPIVGPKTLVGKVISVVLVSIVKRSSMEVHDITSLVKTCMIHSSA